MSDIDEFDGPDLIVAGAGGGLVAALRAAQQGLSVLVVESNEQFRRGNNTSMSTAMIPAMNTRYQREAGVTDSPEIFLSDVKNKTGGVVNEVTATALATHSSALIEWLADDVGLEISLVTDFLYPGHSVARCHTIPGHSGAAMLAQIAQAVSNEDLIDMYVPARLTNVNTEHGRVISVTVETPDGSEEIPTKAVLLATNGYGAEPDLVKTHIPEIAGATYYGSEHSRGDALRIGEEVGAAADYLDAYQGHAGLAMPAASLATWATVMHGGFLVNPAGERYGDESSGYSEYASTSLSYAAEGSWIIIDERIHDACLGFDDYQAVISAGGIKWADSVSDLAHACQIDAEGLQRTYESTVLVANGEMADPFGRTQWSAPLTGRLGAIFVRPALFHTQGGLLTDEHSRVLTNDGSPIAGLYAAGGAAAGISGHGAAGYLAGNGLLSTLGMSFIAANHLASIQ